VLAPKSGITFESRDQRVKRAILMVRRAEPAELCARRIDEPLLEGFDQARLANARLTRQQHDLAVAGPGACPAPQQDFDLLFAANQLTGGGYARPRTG